MSDKNRASQKSINTVITHAGNNPRDFYGFVNPPVVHASTVLFPDSATLASRNQKYTYGTRGTPTSDALADAITEIEGAAGTIVVPSGLAAITVPLLGFVKAGDHILVVDSVYSPTRRFCDTILAKLGVETTYYDPEIGAEIETLFKPNTSIVFTETPGSNTYEIQDIPAIVEVAHRHDAIVMLDNTWATAVFYKAMSFGVDIVVHAGTKYPSGHSDVLLGMVSANEKYWDKLYETYVTFGVCAGPDDIYLVLRGLRSMAVRLAHHEKSALSIAERLQNVEGVARVLHPALPEFPGYDLWKRDFSGSSGLFSIVLDGGGESTSRWKKKADAFLDALDIFGLGYSWGGYESLAVPVFLGDRTVAKAPTEGPVIRLQIGLEDTEDLLADIMQGLAAANAAS